MMPSITQFLLLFKNVWFCIVLQRHILYMYEEKIKLYSSIFFAMHLLTLEK